MTKALDQAPLLPGGSVDFNLLHELAKKGDPAASEKAQISPPPEPSPVPAPAVKSAG
jgi:hypothetical protein